MTLPDPLVEQGNEDTESIEDDIATLYAKFITPIENIRSVSSNLPGNLSPSDKTTIRTGININPGPIESRAHAFYRLLCLPVVDSQGRCYSPGFNSTITNQDTRDSINSAQDSKSLNLQTSRENGVRFYSSLFTNQDLTASIVSLMIGTHPKPFNVLSNPDQSYSVPERTLELAFFTNTNSSLQDSIGASVGTLANTAINTTLDGGLHVLKPFTVNPLLDFTVMPVNNLVAAPFLLDKNAIRSSASPEILHMRPGIEYILRQRLTDLNPDPVFMGNLKNVLSQQNVPTPTFTNNIDVDTLRETLFAFADANNIDSIDINKIFQNITTLESQVIEQLIKTIKVMIDLLRESVAGVEKIKTKFNFIPTPSIVGPEKIGSIRDAQATSQLDVQILQLTIKQLNGDNGPTLDPGLGGFASPFTKIEKTKTYTDQLSSLTQKRNKLGNIGLNLLSNIEIITGEVSGLGLIDILAIYIALWSMDLKDLLGLLDQDSFDRLYNFNEVLRVGPVASKSRSSVTSALTSFETIVTNVLSFADKLFTDSLSSPNITEKGNL